LDDDAYPKSSWLQEASEIFEQNSDLYALGGPAITPESISFPEKMSGRIYESFLEPEILHVVIYSGNEDL